MVINLLTTLGLDPDRLSPTNHLALSLWRVQSIRDRFHHDNCEAFADMASFKITVGVGGHLVATKDILPNGYLEGCNIGEFFAIVVVKAVPIAPNGLRTKESRVQTQDFDHESFQEVQNHLLVNGSAGPFFMRCSCQNCRWARISRTSAEC